MAIFDLGIKMQVTLMELSHVIFWCSVGDLFMFLFAFSVYLTDVAHQATIFIHIFHVGRAVLGGFIIFKLPNSHDLIHYASQALSNANEKISQSSFGAFMQLSAMHAFTRFTENIVKIPLLVYFILTMVMFIADVINFFVGVTFLSNVESEWSYAGCMILILSSIFITLDLYYLVWAASHVFRLPMPTSLNLVLALIGIPQKLAK